MKYYSLLKNNAYHLWLVSLSWKLCNNDFIKNIKVYFFTSSLSLPMRHYSKNMKCNIAPIKNIYNFIMSFIIICKEFFQECILDLYL